jgi:hypothetical protein
MDISSVVYEYIYEYVEHSFITFSCFNFMSMSNKQHFIAHNGTLLYVSHRG